MKSYFITGTDTGVGKTVLSLGLMLCLKELGISAGYMKPIETGVYDSRDITYPGDATLIKRMLNLKAPLNIIRPISYKAPLAPYVASNLEGIELDLNIIKTAYKKCSEGKDIMLIEGAGGLMVPISKELTMCDLAKELDTEIILVTGNKLGALNHTLLTLSHAKGKGLKTRCIILNEHEDEQTNKEQTQAKTTNQKALKSILSNNEQENENNEKIKIYSTPYIEGADKSLSWYKKHKGSFINICKDLL